MYISTSWYFKIKAILIVAIKKIDIIRKMFSIVNYKINKD